MQPLSSVYSLVNNSQQFCVTMLYYNGKFVCFTISNHYTQCTEKSEHRNCRKTRTFTTSGNLTSGNCSEYAVPRAHSQMSSALVQKLASSMWNSNQRRMSFVIPQPSYLVPSSTHWLAQWRKQWCWSNKRYAEPQKLIRKIELIKLRKWQNISWTTPTNFPLRKSKIIWNRQ